jgi:hypothetical protein
VPEQMVCIVTTGNEGLNGLSFLVSKLKKIGLSILFVISPALRAQQTHSSHFQTKR